MRVGLLGFGTVASATAKKLVENNDVISRKTTEEITIVKIATRTVSKVHGHEPEGCCVTDDPYDVVNDPNIDVVVELIGGTSLAKDLVVQAISNGKHVVTANKALLAIHGQEIFSLADEKGVSVLFEGAVAVSIPIIKVLNESVSANRIDSICGILNGTSNYVLHNMAENQVGFESALKEAQEKGYAEADPELDVGGGDAAHKITILASLAFGIPLDFSRVTYQGIESVKLDDIQYVREFSLRLKLIAVAELDQKNHVCITVQPMLVNSSHMLANVDQAMNGVYIHGDLVGQAFFYGAGAGGEQTASSVLSDLIDLSYTYGQGASRRSSMGFHVDKLDAKEYVSPTEHSSAYYIRMRVVDRIGLLSEVTKILTHFNISVDSITQHSADNDRTDILIITDELSITTLNKLKEQLQVLSDAPGNLVTYPLLAS